MKTKVCTGCRVRKYIEEFNICRDNNDGRQIYCKKCRLEYRKRHKKEKAKYDKKYNKQNREKIIKAKKIYYNAHKEIFSQYCKKNYIKKRNIKLQYQKQYARKHKKHISIYQKQYRIDNKDEKIKRDRAYHKAHSEIGQASTMKRRAIKKNIKEFFSTKHRKAVFTAFKFKCFNCNSINNLALDHFYPLSKGHAASLKNAIVLCKSCNSSKHNKSPKRFFSPAKFRKAKKLMKRAENIYKIYLKENK